VLPRIHRTYETLSLAETFRRIYSTNAWGVNGEPFCSGSGSRGHAAELYCDLVGKFIEEHRIRSVVDLGCGDFAIGRQVVDRTGVRYTGIDIVPELIEHHKATVGDSRVNFACIDIARDRLPDADLCLVRQVLQHLSNREIAKVLTNIHNYRYTLISEDVPIRPKTLNRDKPHGPDVRAYYRSGVYIDEPPFSRKIQEYWEIPLRAESVLRTVLVEQDGLVEI
jgi:SAM-dependent methyltransferase